MIIIIRSKILKYHKYLKPCSNFANVALNSYKILDNEMLWKRGVCMVALSERIILMWGIIDIRQGIWAVDEWISYQ